MFSFILVIEGLIEPLHNLVFYWKNNNVLRFVLTFFSWFQVGLVEVNSIYHSGVYFQVVVTTQRIVYMRYIWIRIYTHLCHAYSFSNSLLPAKDYTCLHWNAITSQTGVFSLSIWKCLGLILRPFAFEADAVPGSPSHFPGQDSVSIIFKQLCQLNPNAPYTTGYNTCIAFEDKKVFESQNKLKHDHRWWCLSCFFFFFPLPGITASTGNISSLTAKTVVKSQSFKNSSFDSRLTVFLQTWPEIFPPL